MKLQFETACTAAAQQARARLAADLNQIARRLRQYESERDFLNALLEAAALFAPETALFALENQTLKLRVQKGLSLQPDLSFPLASAHAFASVVTSEELVVSLRTPGEVGTALAGAEPLQRSLLVPIRNSERVAAVLFASGPADIDTQGLELISGLATLALSRKQPQPGFAEAIAPAPAAQQKVSTSAKLPPWSALSEEQRNLHWRAQRFARVKVAEWLLTKAEACRAGLEQNDIYLFLTKEIDSAREIYRTQFIGKHPMVDYLHLELVAAAAEGNEEKLGADYPGPLV